MKKSEFIAGLQKKMENEEGCKDWIDGEILSISEDNNITLKEAKKTFFDVYYFVSKHYVNCENYYLSLSWASRDICNFLILGHHPSEPNFLVSGKNSLYFEDSKAYINGQYTYFNIEDDYAEGCDIFDNKAKSNLFCWNRS